MELRAYWTIIWRRIWLIALIVGVVALYVGYQYYHLRKTANTLTSYSSNVTVQIGVQTVGASPNIAVTTSTAEAFADTLATGPILTSQEFGKQVSNQIAADMGTITSKFGNHPDLSDWQNAGAIGSAITATRIHALITFTVSWGTRAGAWAIAHATGEVISSNVGQYFNYSLISNAPSNQVQYQAIARVISNATDPAVTLGSSASKQLTLLLLLLVALVVGIALAFLLDYLDDRIHSKYDVANLLQLPVYAEVPRAPASGRTRTFKKPQLPAA